MKPQFERVTFPDGCSLRVYNRRVSEIPFEWHHHPEYELTLTLNSRGWRFIGDHIGPYHAPDLALVPPDMPHTWASTETVQQGDPHVAIVIWFSRKWALGLAELCPEYAAMRKLLLNASTGLAFAEETAARVAGRLPNLLSQVPQVRLHAALDVLVCLAGEQASTLSKCVMTISESMNDEPGQLTRVLNQLHKNFHEPISIKGLCRAGNVSERSLHRLFVKHTGGSVSQYLCKLRIGRACMRLVETNLPVSMIAFEVGLPNLANFNRQFLRVRGVTPSSYRKSFQQPGKLDRIPGAEDLSTRPSSLERGSRRRQAIPVEAQSWGPREWLSAPESRRRGGRPR
jgi:AraC-like DNA-binding protein